jgi:TolB protein
MNVTFQKHYPFFTPVWLRNLIAALLVIVLVLSVYLVVRPSPRKGGIAFVANVNGNWDLFIMDGDSTNLTQLTDTPIDERTPALSPNGEQVAYSTSDGAIWVMSLGSKSATRLQLPGDRSGYPAWLSDGTGIIYTSYKVTPPTEDSDFFVYSFQEQNPKLFLMQTGPQDYPALSPSGDRLAYVSSLATLVPGFGSTVTQQLWVVSLLSGKPAQLLVGSAIEGQPAWAPDGERIAFASDRKGNPDIWVIKPDGQGLEQLTSNAASETSPCWSPGGEEVAFVSNESGRMQLSVIDVNTKKSRMLSPFGSHPVEMKDPSWR